MPKSRCLIEWGLMDPTTGVARPLFSVIVPAYNARGTIGDAVTSALDPAVSMEVVVVEDGSPDPVRLEDLPEGPIRLIRCERNGGTARARNRGIREARGTWVAFLDSDDLYEPGRLGAAGSFLSSRSADGLFTDTLIRSPDGSEQVVAPTPDHRGLVGFRRQALIFAALVIRRTAFDEIGLFDPRWHLLEDVDLSLRLLTSSLRIAIMPRPAYVYRQDDESKTRSRDPVEVLRQERDIHVRIALRPGLTTEQRLVLLVRAGRWQAWALRQNWTRHWSRRRRRFFLGCAVGTRFIDESGAVVGTDLPPRMGDRRPVVRAKAIKRNGHYAIYGLFRRDLLTRAPGIPDVVGGDVAFMFSLALRASFATTKRVLWSYRGPALIPARRLAQVATSSKGVTTNVGCTC